MTTATHLMIGCCLLAACAVFVALCGTRGVSARGVISFLSALGLLGICTEISIWSAFIAAGGPDGRFLARDTMLFSAVGAVLGLALAWTALRLLSVPSVLAFVFLLPVCTTVMAELIGHWPTVLAAFTFGPIVCLALVIGAWIRVQLSRPQV